MDLEEIAARVCREGVVVEPTRRMVALILYVHGAIAGALVAWFPAPEAINLSDHRDTLSAISTLAAAALETARDVERLQVENTILMERLGSGDSGIVGQSPAIGKLLQMIARVAPQDTSVLILGESGTGRLWRPAPAERPLAKPFMAINCAALTETLLESELFGHVKGASHRRRRAEEGQARNGGRRHRLPGRNRRARAVAASQNAACSVQQREFERVGGTRTLKLDVRLIAATNRDLSNEDQHGGLSAKTFTTA